MPKIEISKVIKYLENKIIYYNHKRKKDYITDLKCKTKIEELMEIRDYFKELMKDD